VAYGRAPRIAPRLRATSAPGDPVTFATDEHGNVRGGIRTPFLDVPVAKLTGTGNGPAPAAPPTSGFCGIFGQTVPFTAEQLAALYPSHGAFVWTFAVAGLRAFEQGHLTRPDVFNLVGAAIQSDIGA
jgi:hypothetical protein